MKVENGLWQHEGQVWFYVRGGIVYASQIVLNTERTKWEAFDLLNPVPPGQAAPQKIGEFDTVEEAKKAVEQYFEDHQ